MMSTRMNLLLMSPEPATESEIRSAFRTNGHEFVVQSVREPHELEGQLARSHAPIVLVDLDPDPAHVLGELEDIIAHHPGTRFIAMSANQDQQLLLDAMEAGVRRVVPRSGVSSELRRVLERLSAASDHTGRGDLLVILSASGGCGATTIAVNLAAELAEQRKAPSLLIDLDNAYGATSSYLGVSPGYALSHVLGYAGPIDENLVKSTATAHNEQLHVLANPAGIHFSNPDPLDYSRLEEALNCARRAYRTTVVDAPRVPMDVAATLVANSTRTLLVFQQTVKDLRVAQAMLGSIAQRGGSLGQILPVANRWARRQMISLEDAAKTMGVAEIAHVRSDYPAAIEGLNMGQTLLQCAPRSSLRKDLQALLAKVTVPAPR